MTETEANKIKLRDTFQELDITADRSLTQLKAYHALCEWKQENREVDQAKVWKEASIKFHFDDVWTKMMDEKRDINRKVSQETTEHMLWNIDGNKKVNRFLRQLIPHRELINTNGSMTFVVEVAMKAMNERRNESFQINPVVLMSLALENAECTPIETLLFSLPEELMAPIKDEKLREFTDKLTGRHCKRLAMTMNISKQKIDDFIIGNNQYLFDTRELVTEWLRKVECSNYGKRCRLDDAVIEIGRYDLQDFFQTLVGRPKAEEPCVKSHYFEQDLGGMYDYDMIRRNDILSFLIDHVSIFDDDIPQLVKLVKWLPPDKKTQLKNKIGLHDEIDDDEGTLKDHMKKWRDRITTASPDNKVCKDQALKDFQSLRNELTDNPKYTESIVGKITTQELDQEELSRIALNLMMEDVRPISKVLGIDQEKVETFVRQWNNQDSCTTGLLVNLKRERRNREDFCNALRNVGFIDIARSVYCGENG